MGSHRYYAGSEDCGAKAGVSSLRRGSGQRIGSVRNLHETMKNQKLSLSRRVGDGRNQ